MKPVLFQGKRKDTGEWVYGDLIHRQAWSSKFVVIRVSDDGFDHYEEYEVIPETVGQFTGFWDNKGRKIFTGDIISYESVFVGEVVLECGAFGVGSVKELPLFLKNWCENDNYVSFWEICWNSDCDDYEVLPMIEVIGNKHDNPNLLFGG